MKRLIIYRHGERSDLAPPERRLEYSLSHDPPLTSLGHEEAERAALQISKLLKGCSSYKLVSSPLLRCVQTISKLSRIMEAPVHLQDGFSEAFQEYHDDPFGNLYSRHQKEAFPVDVQVLEEDRVTVPKVPESLEEATERMGFLRHHYFPHVRTETLVVCTHLYPIWALLRSVGEGYDERNSKYTQIHEYTYEHGELSVITKGDVTHLDGLYST